jgi:MurNAc alpha-1-phosphate uridylyltransferase
VPDLAGIVLAAGAGTRLRPLTDLVPKALCPVNNVPLVDIALQRIAGLASDIAVNAHHRHDQLEEYLAGRVVHVSVEAPDALGTAGALGRLRPWIAGRDVVVTNGDAWTTADVAAWAEGWDGERVRLLAVQDTDRPDFEGGLRYAGVALLPWRDVEGLTPVPSGLYDTVLRPALAAGRLDLAAVAAPFFDCGTPRDYLAANLTANDGQSVIGPGAIVEGALIRSVVWPGGRVRPDERLVEAIRVGDDLTVDATRR